MSLGPAAGVRLAVVCVAAVGAVLLAEGGLSLLAGRSLRDLFTGDGAPRERRDPTEAQRELGERGLWSVHEDPLVGFTFRRNAELTILDGSLGTDDLGLRVRVGPPAPSDALRVVILGDSVAAGWGVDDDQTLAHHLEQYLNLAAGRGTPPVVCRTVAVPGWNHGNAVAFLRDHMDVLDPDVVLYMPINNDLANTYSVWATGHRRDAPDIATPDPWLRVSTDQTFFSILALQHRLTTAGRMAETTVADMGPQVLTGDLSPESRRRYDENAASIVELSELMAARGGHAGVLQSTEGTYESILWARLDALGANVPLLPLLKHVAPEFTLDGDPHPNPETHRVFGLWAAGALLARGWVEGDASRLPAAPDEYLALRAQGYSPEVRLERARAARELGRDSLRPVVQTTNGHGLYQVYGGVNPDGSARLHALLLLERAGGHLELAIEPLAQRPDLYPLEVTVDVDGVILKTLTVRVDEPLDVQLALPPAPSRADEPIEVRLRAAHAVVTYYKGRSQLSAYRLLAARCVP